MAGMASATPGRLQAEMNLLPMIDVLLVMIVIFLLLSRVRHVIPVQIPSAQRPNPAIGHQSQLVLELTAQGEYRLNGMPVPDSALDRVLGDVFRERPVKLLFIKAAGNRAYREVIGAMDRARGAGVEVLAIVASQ